jgi:hypothetical protein
VAHRTLERRYRAEGKQLTVFPVPFRSFELVRTGAVLNPDMHPTAMPFNIGLSQAAQILTLMGLLAGCSSNSPSDSHVNTPALDAGPSASYSGAFNVTLWGFLDLPPGESGTSAQKPKYVYAAGQVYDGSYPETLVASALPLPDDATPGCAVYSTAPADCSAIGGCGTHSANAECAASAKTNPCVCAAENTCQAYPHAVDAGQVSITGIANTTGATSFSLANLANYYQIPNGVTLDYPGFAEGDELTLSASGGTVPPFQVSANGVAPLTMAVPVGGYMLTRSANGSDTTQYEPLKLEWAPPANNSNTMFEVEIDISRHAGTVGYLGCTVEDTGSLTISAGLVTQLVQLGNVGGYAELAVGRVTSEALQLPDGRGEIEFEVSSEDEYVISVQGYTSCSQDADCTDGLKCDRTIKLCSATQ